VIAPLVASRSKDVAFIVMMAGTGIPGSTLLPLQSELISRAAGIPEADRVKGQEINARLFDMVAKSKDTEKLKAEVTTYLTRVVKDLPANEKPEGMSDEDLVKTQVSQLCSPWMIYFLNYDPIPALKKVKCPVLAINGEKDLQVTIIEFPGMNHLFQECTTGSPNEYSQIEETLSPKMLKVVGEWVSDLAR
jgi:predicted dienelactone hydrolase